VLPAVVALAMLSLLLRLGFWQLSRAEYKEQLQARWQHGDASAVLHLDATSVKTDLAGAAFRKVAARGQFEAEREFLLDNRTHGGRAGYHVITPFRLGSDVILVNRGWVPVGTRRSELPLLTSVTGTATDLTGVLSPPPRSGLILGDTGHDARGPWPRVVQTVDLDAMSATLGVPLLPALLLLDPESNACHLCEWRPVAGMGPGTHRGYAFQWFALAIALAVLCIFAFRRSLRRAA
jgi:cytochrome oxidase assembly protein ShyY1